MQVTYDFSGKSVLLIGGTTGIGRATAAAFAKAGANLFVAGLGAADGASLKAEIKSMKKGGVEFLEVDVRDAKAMAELHRLAFDRFGRIDVAFNNAGVSGKTAPVQDLDEDDYSLLIDVKGIFLRLKHQVPHMIARGGGAIVNTSSLFVVMGFATTAVYCASKWGVIGLTNSVALEVARKNIRVNAIAPGSVMTPLLTNMFGSEQAAKDTVLPMIPMGRISDPSEIARLVLFLSSDAASFIRDRPWSSTAAGSSRGPTHKDANQPSLGIGHDGDGLDLDLGAVLHEGGDLNRGHRRKMTADRLAIGFANPL
jgi:NAD(P)-dependent dehydrogenase (short-subunit alcohol dehydrogenase family)